MRNFAQANNYEIFKDYVDEGASGTTSDRPQLGELFNDAKRGYFDMILVYRIDRFFRSTLNLLSAVDQLQKMGVSFRSVTEPFDTSNPLGNFMITQLGSVAQLERDTFMERTRMGTLKSVRAGHYMASIPLYGYRYNKDTKKLEIDLEESEVVKLIYRLYQEPHSSQTKIAEKLNSMGIVTRKGDKWYNTQIHRILTHPGYYGKWRYTSGSENITINIPPLVSKETFRNLLKFLATFLVFSLSDASLSEKFLF